jgi:hypothetical protein
MDGSPRAQNLVMAGSQPAQHQQSRLTMQGIRKPMVLEHSLGVSGCIDVPVDHDPGGGDTRHDGGKQQ